VDESHKQHITTSDYSGLFHMLHAVSNRLTHTVPKRPVDIRKLKAKRQQLVLSGLVLPNILQIDLSVTAACITSTISISVSIQFP
jgi:hypothetical protein